MKGEIVIVRAYRGKLLIRRIWSVSQDAIQITSDSQYSLLMRKDMRAIGPIGFPREDVFKYDPMFAEMIDKRLSDENFPWSRLKQWSD